MCEDSWCLFDIDIYVISALFLDSYVIHVNFSISYVSSSVKIVLFVLFEIDSTNHLVTYFLNCMASQVIGCCKEITCIFTQIKYPRR